MAKGKFSESRKDQEENVIERFSRALQEDETVLLPNVEESAGEEASQEGTSRMPEIDFDNLEELEELEDLKDLQLPELSALDFEGEDPEYSARFTPIPQRQDPTEEEKIEKSFREAVERSRTKTQSRKKRRSGALKKALILLVCLMGLGLLSMGGLTLYQHFSDPYEHKILNGVQAAGVDLGGMTKDQAVQAVRAAAETALLSREMEVILPDQTLLLSPAAAKVRLDADAVVEKAYDYGRSGSKQQREEDYRNSLTKEYNVDLLPFLSVDKKYILGQLQSYGETHNSSFLPSSYALEGEQPPLDFENFNEKNTPQTLLLNLGNPGFRLDAEGALQEILKAYAAFDLSPVLKLQQGDEIPEPLDLQKIHKEYHIDPVNSSMDMENFDVISGSYGLTFDLEEAGKQLKKAHYGDTLRIPMEYVKPEIMDDGVYFRDVLGRAETPHGTGKQSEKRNINLSLACKALDGMILNPGDEFSYNEALGQRTAEKGYQAAPAYSGDTLVNSLGGGICQVSSTLYYSCLLADLQITDRINHGFLPSYIAPGMDATVSWGKPDFKFKNNTDFPIKIQAQSTEDKVIIEILGTNNRDYYVKMEYEMSDVLPNEIYEEHSPESGYTNGQVINPGTIGHFVKTFRCKYNKETDTLISRDLETRSSYMTRPKIIAVVKEPKPAETTPPATEPPATQPPATEPPATEPAATEPPASQPPAENAQTPPADSQNPPA